MASRLQSWLERRTIDATILLVALATLILLTSSGWAILGSMTGTPFQVWDRTCVTPISNAPKPPSASGAAAPRCVSPSDMRLGQMYQFMVPLQALRNDSGSAGYFIHRSIVSPSHAETRYFLVSAPKKEKEREITTSLPPLFAVWGSISSAVLIDESMAQQGDALKVVFEASRTNKAYIGSFETLSKAALDQFQESYQTAKGVLLGLFIGFSLYNLLQLISGRAAHQAIFSLLCLAFTGMLIPTYNLETFYPTSLPFLPDPRGSMYLFGAGTITSLSMLFLRFYLPQTVRTIKINWSLFGSSFIITLYAAAFKNGPTHHISEDLLDVMIIINMSFQLYMLTRALRAGNEQAKHYLIAWSVTIIVALCTVMQSMGLFLGTSFAFSKLLIPSSVVAFITMSVLFNHEHRSLEKAHDASKERFMEIGKSLQAISHDSRQMIASLAHFADLLRIKTDVSAKNQIADHIETVSTTLSDLLTNTLRADESDIHLNELMTSCFCSDRIFDTLRIIFRPHAAEKKVNVRFLSIPSDITTDRLLLLRIIGNFLSNALKHSRATDILITCRPVGNSIRYRVYDNGIGLDPAKLDLTMLDPGETRHALHKSEFGVGLASSARLADRLDGRMRVFSRRRRGTCAELTLPTILYG